MSVDHGSYETMHTTGGVQRTVPETSEDEVLAARGLRVRILRGYLWHSLGRYGHPGVDRI